MRLARGDHREAVLGLLHPAVEDHRPRRMSIIWRILASSSPGLVGADAHAAIGLGQLHEVGQAVGIGVAVALAVQQLLPLAHHPHPLVVEDEDLDRQVVLHRRRHLLHGHLHRGLAGDVDDQAVRMRDLHAHRRRQAIAHGAQAAGGHPAVRLVEVEELRRPHLVLAHLGGDVDVPVPGQGVEALDGVLRLDHGVRRPVARSPCGRATARSGPTRPPGVASSPPLALPGRDHVGQHIGRRRRRCPRPRARFLLIDDGSISTWIFLEPGEKASRRPVTRSSNRAPRQTITSQSCMAWLASKAPCMPTMPSQAGSRRRKGAQAHQGRGHRRAGEGRELAQQGAGLWAGVDDAAAGIDQRPLGLGDQLHGLVDAVRVALSRAADRRAAAGLPGPRRRRWRTGCPWGCPPPPGRAGPWWRYGTPHEWTPARSSTRLTR